MLRSLNVRQLSLLKVLGAGRSKLIAGVTYRLVAGHTVLGVGTESVMVEIEREFQLAK